MGILYEARAQLRRTLYESAQFEVESGASDAALKAEAEKAVKRAAGFGQWSEVLDLDISPVERRRKNLLGKPQN